VPKRWKITQIRSKIGKHKKRKRTLEALGLGRIGKTVIHKDTPQIRGMIRLVSDLVRVEELEASDETSS